MKIHQISLLTLFYSLAFSVAAATAAVAQTSSTTLPDAPSATVHDEPPAVPTGSTVLFDTTMGRLTCKFFDKEAPVAVANFTGLSRGTKTYVDPTTAKKMTGTPFYNGTTFHRVIPGFMIQGGDKMGNGTGDAGYFFEDEISPSLRFDVPGRLAMANSGPNTNGTQFFITEAPQPALNGHYTIFGQCDEHTVLLVATIARVDRNADDKPLTPVVINKVTIVPAGQPVPPEPAAPATQPASGPTTSSSALQPHSKQ